MEPVQLFLGSGDLELSHLNHNLNLCCHSHLKIQFPQHLQQDAGLSEAGEDVRSTAFAVGQPVKIPSWSEMNPFGLFCIGRSEFVFHLDGELNRDG